MAQVEEIVRWLDTYLDVKDPWNGKNISLFLNRKTIQSIKSVFVELQPQKKLKVLLSIFHMSSVVRKEELNALLETALDDCEESVSILAEMMEPYPSTGRLKSSDFNAPGNEKTAKIFKDLVDELSEELKSANAQCLIPLEYYYLNKSALEAEVETHNHTFIQKPPVQHFQVKGTTKSERLREKMIENLSSKVPSRKRTWETMQNEEGNIPLRIRARPKKQSEIFRRKEF